MAPTNTSDTIYQTACRLFDELWDGTPVRLLGIRTSKLVTTDEPVQLNLMDYMTTSNTPSIRSEKKQKLDAALDSIRNRYGTSAVVRGSMLKTRPEFKE
jgi:DNA polymerase-4